MYFLLIQNLLILILSFVQFNFCSIYWLISMSCDESKKKTLSPKFHYLKFTHLNWCSHWVRWNNRWLFSVELVNSVGQLTRKLSVVEKLIQNQRKTKMKKIHRKRSKFNLTTIIFKEWFNVIHNKSRLFCMFRWLESNMPDFYQWIGEQK